MGSRESLRARYGAPAIRPGPFLLISELPPNGARLIAPFAKRRGGLAPDEAALVRSVTGLLRGLPPAGSVVWIDPADGTATPATIGEPQIRRRLVDCASVSLRLRTR